MSDRERGSWWLLGRLYLPKAEVCPRRGHRGFSWVTEGNVVGWEVELYDRNVELILTQDVAWYPVSGVTSYRPQVYHPLRLKEREVSVSGNPQTYVVFHEGRRIKSG